MERVVREGQVATAATYAHMFSSLPSCGRPTRLMVYDLHTLQNRFYLVSFNHPECSTSILGILSYLYFLVEQSTAIRWPLYKLPSRY